MRWLLASLLVACATPAPLSGASAAPARARPPAPHVARAAEPSRTQEHELSVREVVQLALAAAKGLSPERIRELARRARMTGLAPQLRLSAERGLQQDLSSSTSATQVEKTATGDDFSFGATLTFQLDRLVFAPDEVRLLSVERWLAADQRKLAGDTVKLYFQRKRLLREKKLTSAPDAELDDSLAEVDAQLDALTAGAFSSSSAR